MTIQKAGSQRTTLSERLSSIPLPRVWLTDKEWGSSIVSELRPYFILPRMEPAAFLEWMDEELGIRDLSEEDLAIPALKDDVDRWRKGDADRFWMLEKNDRTEMFYDCRLPDEIPPGEERGDDIYWILIGYHPEEDVFYSTSNFLTNVMYYFRGIGPEDLLRESKEIYPVRTAKAYAVVLDGVLRGYSCWRGVQIARRILRAETLTVSGPGGQTVRLPGSSVSPVFLRFFFDHAYMDTEYPQTEADRAYHLVFSEADGSQILLWFGGGGLYFGQREYYVLRKMTAQLTDWLHEILGDSPPA